MEKRRILKRPAWLSGMRWVWRLGGLTAGELARRVWREIDEDDVLGRAAQLAYYFMLALFPLLIFVSAVLGQIFSGNAGLYVELMGYLQRVMPPLAYDLVRATADEITKEASGGKLTIGLVVTLWAASSGMDALINGLNVAYKVTERRAWWKRRIVAIALTILLAGVSGAALLLTLSGGQAGSLLARRYNLGESFDRFWLTLQIGFPTVFMLLVFGLVYRFAPSIKHQRWQAFVPGTFVGVAVWLAATGAFRVYLRYLAAYSKTYGSLGAVVVLMLWLYLTGIAILVGGEVNSQIRRAAAAAGAPAAREEIQADS